MQITSSEQKPKNPYRYIGANPTVDIVVLHPGNTPSDIQSWKVLLVRRAAHTVEGGKLALPGGFHDTTAKRGEAWTPGHETALEAALRELREETDCPIEHELKIFEVGVFEGNNRDPRDNDVSWSRSTAFGCILSSNYPIPDVSGQDPNEVSEADWHEIGSLSGLAFDHEKILNLAILIIRENRWEIDLFDSSKASPKSKPGSAL